MTLKNRPRDIGKGFCPEVPAVFTSLVQARNSLDYHWNICIEFLYDLEANGRNLESTVMTDQGLFDDLGAQVAIRKEYYDAFERWLVAFQAFMHKHEKSLDGRGMQAARTLQISHGFALIFLNNSITINMLKDETAWDRSIKQFENVVGLASLIVESSTCDQSTKKRGPDFTLDMNIVAPLYAAAHRCRQSRFSPLYSPTPGRYLGQRSHCTRCRETHRH